MEAANAVNESTWWRSVQRRVQEVQPVITWE